MKKVVWLAVVFMCLTAGPSVGFGKTPSDTLILAWRFDDIISMDPAELFEISAYEIVGNVYDTLCAVNPANTNEILPRAAKSWSVGEDGKTYTFNLKPGMKFHNGDPVTAGDVAYSFKRLAAMDKGPAFLIQDLGITKDNLDETLKAVDDLTFQMTVDKPYAPSYVLNVICSSNFSIANAKVLKANEKDGDWGNSYLKTHSAGSGPFTLLQWRPDELIVVQANPDYHGGAPILKKVVWRHVSEESSQRLLLESGDVDIARSLSADQLESLRKKGGLHLC